MSSRLPKTPSSITLPDGFSASGVHCGLKANYELDLGLILCNRPVAVAALFTENALQGAHIQVCREHLLASEGMAKAILVNSRNANCATGEQGILDAKECCEELAKRLNCPTEQILMASTGPIGAPLPSRNIIDSLDSLISAANSDGGMRFANAIMTTDTHEKIASAKGQASVMGFAKGSGMIHPNMATMLGFIVTNAQSDANLHAELQQLANRSFHRTTVDGDTSPNDSLFFMASGSSGVATTSCSTDLLAVATDLAKQLAADGEGATRLITIEVRGASSEDDAAHIGRVIATSPLVKTAVAGRDPNWGRILAAAGRANIPFSTDAARVWVGETEVFTRGTPHPQREAAASLHLQQEERVTIGIDIGSGTAKADTWTCDLTADYISINADYRT